MIQKYIIDLSTNMAIPISQVSVVAGHQIGCLGVDLVHIYSGSDQVSLLVYRDDYDELLNSEACIRLEKRVRTALEKLKVSGAVSE